MKAGRRTTPGRNTAALRTPRPAQPAAPHSPTPGAPTAPTSTCPSTSRSPGLNRYCRPATATQRTSPTCSAPPTVSITTCRVPRHARLQLDLAEQLQRRPRRGLPWEQPLGRVLWPDHPEHTGQLHRRAVLGRPVPRTRHPRDRGIAGVQGRRPDRRHVRRGLPAVHLLRQQLRQFDGCPGRRGDLDRRRLGRRDAVRAWRALRADRPEHAAGKERRRRRALPRTGRQRLHRPPEQLRRPDGSGAAGRAPACSAAAVPSQVRARTPKRVLPAGSSTIEDNAIVATDEGPLGDRGGHPRGRVRRPGHRHAGHRDRSQPERRFRGQRLVRARRRRRRTRW